LHGASTQSPLSKTAAAPMPDPANIAIAALLRSEGNPENRKKHGEFQSFCFL